MFGKIRSSSSPLESLQRPPSKLLKDDSLSIYESTLLKLRRGSNCKLSSPSDQFTCDKDNDSASISNCIDPMKINIHDSVSSPAIGISPNNEAMVIDTECNLPGKLVNLGEEHSERSSKEEGRPVSVLYMFAKYKSARKHAPDSVKIVENASKSPVNKL